MSMSPPTITSGRSDASRADGQGDRHSLQRGPHRRQILDGVDIERGRARDQHVREVQFGEEVARTGVTLDAGEPVEQLARERDRVAGEVGVARPGRRHTTPHGRRDRPDRLRADPRLVREEHHGHPRTLVMGHGPDARRERGRLPQRMVGVGHDLHLGVLHPRCRRHRVTVVADHDHHPVDAARAGRGDRMGHQGATGHDRQLFGAAREACAAPGSQHEGHDGCGGRGPTLVLRPTEDRHVATSPSEDAEPTPGPGTTPGSDAGHPTDPRRRAVVVTASDGVAYGHRPDGSGDAVTRQLQDAGFTVIERVVVADDRETIAERLRQVADAGTAALVAITGGTGFGPRDVTPEATRDVIDREAPGLAEAMRASGRASTPMADLSRGVCGVRGSTLLVDLPGSPRGATESLAAVLQLLPHAIDLLAGDTREHPAGHGEHGVPAS